MRKAAVSSAAQSTEGLFANLLLKVSNKLPLLDAKSRDTAGGKGQQPCMYLLLFLSASTLLETPGYTINLSTT